MAYAEFLVKAEWEFESGKFASRDSIVEAVMDEITSADPGSIDAEDGTYQVVTWDVEEQEVTKPLPVKQLIEKLKPACAVLGIDDPKKIEQFILLYRASGGVLW